jgi:hypothetical protein
VGVKKWGLANLLIGDFDDLISQKQTPWKDVEPKTLGSIGLQVMHVIASPSIHSVCKKIL